MLAHPLPGYVITTPFNGYPGHKGADFAAPLGTPILAAHDGVVRMSGWYGGAYSNGGNLVYLTANDGRSETSYQHMRSQPVVSVGQQVSTGQVLGYVGSTGYSFGPHLHFEYWLNGLAWQGGTAVDPALYIDQSPQPKPQEPAQEELDEMAANQTATIVRDYERDINGEVMLALIYPDGTAVKLNKTQDVDALGVAHIRVYNLPITGQGNWREKYGSQLNARQWDAFWKLYPYNKVGF